MAVLQYLLDQLASSTFVIPVTLLTFLIIAYLYAYNDEEKRDSGNPFSTEVSLLEEQAVNDAVPDPSHSDRIIKQGFAQKKIPVDLDAIVIGSGISGLCTAALLAKTGKKVLVLEQHDQAGGCCHTFTENGFEFDVGIHYVGKIHQQSFSRTLLDQISDGKIEWQPLDENFDTVVIGYGEKSRKIPLRSGKNYRNSLVEAFPDEAEAIDKFIADLKAADKATMGLMLLKILPVWLLQIICRLSILDYFIPYSKWAGLKTQDHIDSLTTNPDLKAVFAYAWGDYGSPPEESTVLMNAGLFMHFMNGAGYPVGGASQIAMNIVPVIERAGGKVLVRANVSKILMDVGGRAIGVEVTKGQQEAVSIYAPIVVSAAGVVNTLNLLPKEVAEKTTVWPLLEKNLVRTGHAAFSLFVGLRGSAEELGLKAQNIWAFPHADLNRGFRESTQEPSFDADTFSQLPIMFLSFPSVKDPKWREKNPDKTTCTVVTIVNYKWFEAWENEQVKHRSTEYENIKKSIGDQLWKQVLDLFPQLKDRIEYFECGSPLTNNYYIGANKGEIYGLDHNATRWRWDVQMRLRPSIGVPGLYVTGQDIMTAGFSGGLYSGLLCASDILDRNLYNDCNKLHKSLIEKKNK